MCHNPICYCQKQITFTPKQKNREVGSIESKLRKIFGGTQTARQKIYSNNRYKADLNFRLICKTRSRICPALKGNSKSSSTKEILGIDVNVYRKWIEGEMTPEMNWSNIEIDHVKPICMFDISKD